MLVNWRRGVKLIGLSTSNASIVIKKMSKKTTSIPVHSLAREYQYDFIVIQVTPENLNALHETENTHRHDYHIFSLIRKGIFHIEIDFKSYEIEAPAILYIHPSQIHRIIKIEKADVFLLGVNSENLNPDYLRNWNKLFYMQGHCL